MPVRSGKQRPLHGRVVLVVGAGDATARQLALHLSARGAAIVAAGPHLPPLLETAGLVAATHGVARVIEAPSPPLLGDGLMRAATAALARPTDVVIASSAFSDLGAARVSADELRPSLASDANLVVVPLSPPSRARAEAERLVAEWLAGGSPDPDGRVS